MSDGLYGNYRDGREAAMAVAHARRTDPDESRWAAEGLGDLRAKQADVLTVFRLVGAAMGDEQLVMVYNAFAETGRVAPQSVSGIRTRRSELVRKGFLVRAPRNCTTIGGNSAGMWEVAR